MAETPEDFLMSRPEISRGLFTQEGEALPVGMNDDQERQDDPEERQQPGQQGGSRPGSRRCGHGSGGGFDNGFGNTFGNGSGGGKALGAGFPVPFRRGSHGRAIGFGDVDGLGRS